MGLGQDDVDVLSRRPDRDPAEPARCDVVANLEAERVAVEAERLVGVVDRDEHGGNGDCHDEDGTFNLPSSASPILLASADTQTVVRVRCGRVPTLLTHGGTTSRSR